MQVSYEKLWALVAANKMKKRELAQAASVSATVMAKLRKNQTVSMNVMIRFCKIFHCDIGDVMEVIEDDED